MKVLVSACLLGRNCKYNGGNNYSPAVMEFLKDKDVVQVCPEVMAGLPVPRIPMEIVNGILMDKAGNNVDELLRLGVQQALEFAREQGIDCAVLKSRSPTCGVRQIYDGTFSGTLVNGSGVTLCGDMLENNGNAYDLHKWVMDQGYLCPILFKQYTVYTTRGAAQDLDPAIDWVIH